MLNVILKSNAGYQTLPLQAMLFSQRMMFITGEITSDSVIETLQQLLYLQSEDEKSPVKIIMNSPGGSVSAGLILYQQIKAMKVPIEIYCVEMCASMAAVILAGGQKGHRYILRGSKCMLHEPLISPASGISGSANEVKKTTENLIETKQYLNEILARETEHSVNEIDELLTHGDYFLTDIEAINFGLADAIVDHI